MAQKTGSLMAKLVTKFSSVSRDLIKLSGGGKTFRSITFFRTSYNLPPNSQVRFIVLPMKSPGWLKFAHQSLLIVTYIMCLAINYAIKLKFTTVWHINGYFDKIIRLPPAHPQVRYICPYFDDLLWIHFILNQTVCLLTYLLKHCCTWSRNDF